MKLGVVIGETASAERDLAAALRKAGEAHKSDHDVFHLTGTLAELSADHVERLRPHGERYSASIDAGTGAGFPWPIDALVEKGSEILDRHPESASLLLRDLRSLHLLASEASIDWVMLGQGAQAVKDTELLETVSACHAETLRTLKWTTYRIKTASPQALAGG